MINKKLGVVAATIATGFVLLSSVAVGQISGNTERGKKLYYDHGCYACHGYNGIGRHNIANNASGIMVNEQVFIIYLRARANQNPQFPTQTMPNYSEASLSDEAARDIYAYIKTLVDDPPDVDKIPALKAILEGT